MSDAVTGARGALRRPLLRRFLLAGLISGFGAHVQTVASGWMMGTLTERVWMIALVQTASSLPILLFALIAGALADVYDRRILLMVSQCVMLSAALALAALGYASLITPWALLSFTFVLGCGMALHAPAWQASLGDIAPGPDLAEAVTLNSLGTNLARSAGPALGGAIVTVAGASAAFLFNALSYVGVIWTLVRWLRPTPQRTLPPERLAAAIWTGLRYALLSSQVRDALGRALTFGLISSALWALTPALARDRLGGGPQTYGALLAAFGLGAVCGAAAITVLRHRLGHEAIIRSATALFALAVLSAATAPTVHLALPGLFLAGASWVVGIATLNVHVQIASPRWVAGRAVSIFQMSAFGGMAVGSALFGLAASVLGVSEALVLSAVLMALSVGLGRPLRLRDQDPADLALAPPQSQPALAATLGGDAVTVVSIEYRIRPEDADRFLILMDRNARARLRAGSRRWRLYRDGLDLGLWIEQFESANWSEHLRQRGRRSASDRQIQLGLWDMHQGESPPRVRRLLRTATA